MLKRSPENPILLPETKNSWESAAAFNPSVVEFAGKTILLYRAQSSPQKVNGQTLSLSSIGIAMSADGTRFKNKRPLITPSEDWDKFGCEDPRVTKIGSKFYIFYTALSEYPFRPEGIRVGLAITKDFKTIESKHLITPFNAKAMCLFPAKINGKFAALLTANTDRPPAKICLALFDKLEDLWSKKYWDEWYKNLDSHAIQISKNTADQVEVGAVPIKVSFGLKPAWMLIYSHIENYFTPRPIFTIRALALDSKDPKKVLGKTETTLLFPEEEYEIYGAVPNIVFPSGAIVKKKDLWVYYGAADTTCAVAKIKLADVVDEIHHSIKIKLERYNKNPILSPVKENGWESRAVFNPAAIYEEGVVRIVYRAMSEDNTSTFGYAESKNGLDISLRLKEPIYVPREDFEAKKTGGANSGCEDPRITRIGDTLYMCYTAYDSVNPPRVALTSISLADFLAKKWNWSKPLLISPPGESDKDAALFPKKINGKYAFLHRLGSDIWIDYADNLDFQNNKWLGGKVLMSPRAARWDSKKIGIASPPIPTKHGWLLLYHGISKDGTYYRAKASLLDLKDPSIVLARTTSAIIEPEMDYEKEGEVRNVVFPCGAVILKDKLVVYYGGADKFVGVASIKLDILLKELLYEAKKRNKIV